MNIMYKVYEQCWSTIQAKEKQVSAPSSIYDNAVLPKCYYEIWKFFRGTLGDDIVISGSAALAQMNQNEFGDPLFQCKDADFFIHNRKGSDINKLFVKELTGK